MCVSRYSNIDTFSYKTSIQEREIIKYQNNALQIYLTVKFMSHA